MALVLADRVQQTGTANTTVSFTLSGSVTGFQSFAVVGNTNTTYYSAYDASGNWEVGIGTYSTTGPTLTRTTILSSSNSGSAVTFSGTVSVLLTYPSGKSVNLNASGNVSALGTVSSGVWQGTAVGTAYGGTGATSAQGGMNALAGAVTSGSYLRGNGTNVVMNTIQAADVPTLNQNTTGSSGSCTGNAATATTATNQSGGTVSATTGGFTGQVTFAGGSQVGSTGDFLARRSSGSTGVYYFGNGTPYLYYDGANFNFSGGAIYGAGTGLTGTASSLTAGTVTTTGSSSNVNYNVAFLNGTSVLYSSNLAYNPATNTLIGGSFTGTSALANGVNQYPNRTDSAWYQAVWSNAAGGDKNIYSASTVGIYSGNYGYVGFGSGGSTWYIGGDAGWGLGSNTGLILAGNLAVPIMYDSNNTGYYCDPTGRSNLSQATFPNGFQFSGRFCFNGSGSNLDNGTGMWFEENYGIYAVGASSLWNLTVNTSLLAGFTGGGGVYGNGNGYFTGGVNQYYSDERLKDVQGTITNALEKVLSLDGFIYVENEVARSLGYTNEKEQVGVSAQKVQKVLPQAVSLAPCDMQGVPETGEIVSKSGENYLTVDYSRLVPLLIEAIKEQQTQIDELKAQVLKGK